MELETHRVNDIVDDKDSDHREPRSESDAQHNVDVGEKERFTEFKDKIADMCKELEGSLDQIFTSERGLNSQFIGKCEEFFKCRKSISECWATLSTGKIGQYQDIDEVMVSSGTFNGDMRQMRLDDGQVVDNLRELYDAAAAARPIFEEYLHQITAASSIIKDCPHGSRSEEEVLLIANLKGIDRAAEKAKDDYNDRIPGPGVGWLFDIVRGCIICKNETEICSVLNAMGIKPATSADQMPPTEQPTKDVSLAESVSIVRLKNRFAKPTPGGFRDINANIRVKIGESSLTGKPIYHTCELQIHCSPITKMSKSLHSHAVYEFFRVYFRGSVQAVEGRMRMLETMFQSLSTQSSSSSFGLSFQALAALSEACASLSPHDESGLSVLISRISDILSFFRVSGELEMCKKLYLLLLEIETYFYGPESLSTLKVFHNLGTLLHEMGDYSGACTCLQRVLEGREKMLGPDSIDTITTVLNLGIVLDTMGDKKASKVYLERALVASERTLGSQHLLTLSVVNSLGNLLHNMRDIENARVMFERAFVGFEKQLGPENDATLSTCLNLANILREKRDFAGARLLYERVLMGREKQLGPDHPTTLTSANNLGNLLRQVEEYASALALFERVLDGRERALGSDHRDTLATHYNMGLLVEKMGEKERAMSCYDVALTGFEKSLGVAHNYTLMAMCTMADLKVSIGDKKQGKVLYERALFGYEKSFGPTHRMTVNALMQLVGLEKGMGDHQLARSRLERAVAGLENTLGKDDTTLLLLVSHLGSILSEIGDNDANEALFKKFSGDVKEFPDTLIVPAKVHQHPLILQRCSYPGGKFGCDICHKAGFGWVYSCTECGFDVHLRCGTDSSN